MLFLAMHFVGREGLTEEFPRRENFNICIHHLGKAIEDTLPEFVNDTKQGVMAGKLVSKIKILKCFYKLE